MSFTTKDTESQQIDYIESNGTVCPYCEHEGDIHGNGDVEIGSGYGFQEVYCGYCGTYWSNVFQLVGFRDLEQAGDAV